MSAVGAGRAPLPMIGVESMGKWDRDSFFGASSFPLFASTGREVYTGSRMGDPVTLNHHMTMGGDGMMPLVSRGTKTAVGAMSNDATGSLRTTRQEDEALDRDLLGTAGRGGEVGLAGTGVTGCGREGAPWPWSTGTAGRGRLDLQDN